ncbi:hypothetical protein G6011_02784 [Alternaria panax]|uniref:Uncharacterized protein n=1 Tax=Alternaria panax TaxID=48097 RepID=A0AAD4FCD1_9PLEO|nr:hypothetical protein G6011_02784 [Alternaria panax]
MQLHIVALRPSPSELPASARPSQINSLLSALQARKRFLDTLLSFPAHEYHLVSFSEWMRLPAVIMTVARLCIPSEEHAAIGWDTQAAQDRLRLDLCLESICYRMQTLSTCDKTKRSHLDFWHAMRMINDLTKNCTSEGSCLITGAPRTHPTNHSGDRYNDLSNNDMDDFNIDMPLEDEVSGDPFAFMRSADFDMGQFFDMAGSIWGEESYNNYTGMAYGGGAPF